jgi:AcrR family transcriptional regulator
VLLLRFQMQSTQQAIIDAAIGVFNEDYSAPLEQVAAQAGVTRRTLHRYFAGREELLACCELEMQRTCRLALTQALDSSADPLTQLENMLYAVVDCGAKYSFFHKLHTQPQHRGIPHAGEADYDVLHGRYRRLIEQLQMKGLISPLLSAEWVKMLMSGIVSATINADSFGAVDKAHTKQFAWFSFSKGIGL